MHTDIRRDAETHDWTITAHINGRTEYLGSRQTRAEAETLEREWRYHYFLDNDTPEHAAAAVREVWGC